MLESKGSIAVQHIALHDKSLCIGSDGDQIGHEGIESISMAQLDRRGREDMAASHSALEDASSSNLQQARRRLKQA